MLTNDKRKLNRKKNNFKSLNKKSNKTKNKSVMKKRDIRFHVHMLRHNKFILNICEGRLFQKTRTEYLDAVQMIMETGLHDALKTTAGTEVCDYNIISKEINLAVSDFTRL